MKILLSFALVFVYVFSFGCASTAPEKPRLKIGDDVIIQTKVESALRVLLEIAEGRGFKIIEGLISFPADIQILEGVTDLLSYDKETNQFNLKL